MTVPSRPSSPRSDTPVAGLSHTTVAVMPTLVVSSRFVAIVIVVVLTSALAGCGRSESSAAYKAACHGPPLRTVAQHEKAMTEGYTINQTFKCIDKASFEAVAAARARAEAANTPEAKAEREAQRERAIAKERAAQAALAEKQRAEPIPAPPAPLRIVDVNVATESELSNVAGVGPALAAQILEERNKGPFRDWADLVRRVIGISSARNAAFASIGGLTVNGESLPGAPPDAVMAASIRQSQNPQRP